MIGRVEPEDWRKAWHYTDLVLMFKYFMYETVTMAFICVVSEANGLVVVTWSDFCVVWHCPGLRAVETGGGYVARHHNVEYATELKPVSRTVELVCFRRIRQLCCVFLRFSSLSIGNHSTVNKCLLYNFIIRAHNVTIFSLKSVCCNNGRKERVILYRKLCLLLAF